MYRLLEECLMDFEDNNDINNTPTSTPTHSPTPTHSHDKHIRIHLRRKLRIEFDRVKVLDKIYKLLITRQPYSTYTTYSWFELYQKCIHSLEVIHTCIHI